MPLSTHLRSRSNSFYEAVRCRDQRCGLWKWLGVDLSPVLSALMLSSSGALSKCPHWLSPQASFRLSLLTMSHNTHVFCLLPLSFPYFLFFYPFLSPPDLFLFLLSASVLYPARPPSCTSHKPCTEESDLSTLCNVNLSPKGPVEIQRDTCHPWQHARLY